jgi:hypothetical protein
MLAGVLVFLLAGGAARPPVALATSVRRALDPHVVTVSSGSGELRFWFRRDSPPRRPGATPRTALELQRSDYAITPGSFVGAMEVRTPWTDARGQPIPPGVYTLRYALQPLTKDHLGLSPRRDFLLLAPAARDRDPAIERDVEKLWAAGREASGTGHPAVLGLGPPGDGRGTGVRIGGIELRFDP